MVYFWRLVVQKSSAPQSSITNIEALRDMPLKYLPLNGTSVSDLSPLRGAPLTELQLDSSNVADLSPLANAPLIKLMLYDCRRLHDVRALAACPTLVEVTLPAGIDPTPLRGLPNLQRISYRHDARGQPAQTTAEFWADYDAQQAAGPK